MSNRPPFPDQNQQPPRQKLTDDEFRVLRECNQESFYQRCLPMSIGAMFGTQVLVKRGIWKPHPRYGSFMKLCGLDESLSAGLLGYIVGKASYQQKCRDKILALENSPLADAFRNNRPDLIPDLRRATPRDQPRIILPPTSDEIQQASSFGSREDYISTGSINDEQNKQLSGLSDQFKPNMDSDNSHADHSLISPSISHIDPGVSYGDLQQRNRDAYAARTATSMPRSYPQAPPTSDHHLPAGETPPQTPGKKVRRNQFGDVIED